MVTHGMTLLLSAFILMAQAASADDCKTSGIQGKEGYIAFDQTNLSKKGKARLINHAISVTTAIASTYKMVKSAAVGCKAPSYFLYNGANVMDGVANIKNLVKQTKESEQILQSFVGEGSNIQAQIDVFDRAYEQQMAAYRGAKTRERILKTTRMLRKSAVVSAGVESAIMMGPLAVGAGLFICSPNPETSLKVKEAVKTAREAGNEAAKKAAKDNLRTDLKRIAKESAKEEKKWQQLAMGQNISGMVANAILKAIGKEHVGEITPLSRLTYYGVQEALAMAMAADMNETSNCMKQRAHEFKSMGSVLKQRLGKTTVGPGDDDDDGNGTKVVTIKEVLPPTEEFNPGDFAGCMARSASGLVHDSQCSCRQNNSCYEIPRFVSPQSPNNPDRSDAFSSFPPNIASNNNQGRDFLNGVFSDNISKANLGAKGLGQGAARLDRQVKGIQKKINDNLKKQGKRPINFKAQRGRIADNIQRAVGNALNKAGIKSIGQFNQAIGDALVKNPNPSPSVEKTAPVVAGKAKRLNPTTNSKDSFDFLEDDGEYKIEDMDNNATEKEEDSYFAQEADIQSSGQNIFQILTYRYMKSAYPSLLKKVKKGPSPSGKADPF